MRPLTALIAGALTVAVTPRAQACSCREPRLSRTVVPADGTTGLPVDGTVRVFLHAFPTALRQVLARDYRVVDANGVVVPLEAQLHGRRLDLRPTAPLRPGETYRVEQVFAFDPDGNKLTDSQHWLMTAPDVRRGSPFLRRAAPDRVRMQRSFVPVSSFVTSAGKVGPPPVPDVQRATVEFAYGGGDCGPATSLAVAYAFKEPPGPDVIVDLELKSGGVVDSKPAHKGSFFVSDELCMGDKTHLGFKGPFDFRLVAVDGSGRRAPSNWVSPSVEEFHSPWGRQPYYDEPDAPLREDGEAAREQVEGWFDPPVVERKPTTLVGPKECASGFAVAKRTVLEPPDPWRASTRLAAWVSSTGDVEVAVHGESGKGSGVFASSGLRQLPVVGLYESTVAPAPKGLVVAGPRFGGGLESALVAARVGDNGTVIWETVIVGQGRNWDAATAVAGDAVLVAWRASDAHFRSHPGLAVLDAATGKVRGTHRFPLEFVDDRWTPALMATPEGFEILWERAARDNPGAVWTSLSSDGALKQQVKLELAADQLDMIAVGNRRIAVGRAREGIVLAEFSREGKCLGKPVVVSIGSGRSARHPRVLAVTGSTFAVAWVDRDSDDLRVAAADVHGNVSPQAPLGDVELAWMTAAVRQGRPTIIGTAVHGERAVAFELQCRNPPTSAPAAR